MKTNNTNCCEIGEKVYSEIDMQDIIIKGISPRWTKELNGIEGLSHAYIYEINGEENIIWPWEICRYNKKGEIMLWGPGIDDQGNYINDQK